MAEGRAGPAPEEVDSDIIPHDQLRKYIAYAKQSCRPKLQNADYDKIAQVPLSCPLMQGFMFAEAHALSWICLRRAQCPHCHNA